MLSLYLLAIIITQADKKEGNESVAVFFRIIKNYLIGKKKETSRFLSS